jgi:hypothetical protein
MKVTLWDDIAEVVTTDGTVLTVQDLPMALIQHQCSVGPQDCAVHGEAMLVAGGVMVKFVCDHCKQEIAREPAVDLNK